MDKGKWILAGVIFVAAIVAGVVAHVIVRKTPKLKDM